MSSCARQRFLSTEKENRVHKAFKGKVHFLAIGLDYHGTNAGDLTCIVDCERVTEVARKAGVKDIVKLYDDGSTPYAPSPDGVLNEITIMAERCKPGDYFVLMYSGHGGSEPNPEAIGGIDTMLILREGNEIALLCDDVLSDVIAGSFHPEVRILMLADACHSGNVLDCDAPIWGGSGRKVAAISGCQDGQTSADTGDGGAMTNALLRVLALKKIAKRRKKREVSVQFIFNRMVAEMPEDEDEEGEEFDEEEWDYSDQEWSEDEYVEDEEAEECHEANPGQNINLSWIGGCDPSMIAFPF